ncbi:MAG: hypothetical protein K2R98_14870 [Gemmataceae bacterium]|nr:hypothetical protein [Gemmataceae bacterium]
MPWPLSQDYNEAIQHPSLCFADAELKQCEAATNALGLPVPCSGNFADVYQLRFGERAWAVKCFTREIPGLRERYAEVSKYLQQVQMPFMVNFLFLEQGIRVRGQWFPILKMDWVEGLVLNAFVRDNLDKPQVLDMLGQIWIKLSVWLREAQLAHCDLQHGNVLLVPGARAGTVGVRLVDYDGMCVPALELLKSIELGHANYQHPQRLREGTYGLHIDRFSHLVIYTGLRALLVGGKPLWEKYDNGDNLLFTQKDFENPRASALFQDLIKLNDPHVRKLTQVLAAASQKPIDQVPALEQLAPPTNTPTAAPVVAPGADAATGQQRRTAIKAAPLQPVRPDPVDPFAATMADGGSSRRTRYQARRNRSPAIAVAAVLAALVMLLGGTALYFASSSSGNRPTDAQLAQKASESIRPITRALRVYPESFPMKLGGLGDSCGA